MMSRSLFIPFLAIIASLTVLHAHEARADETAHPHVVIIMADDLGYGDVRPLNPDSPIPTPAFDRLAAEGITFTDAHTPSAVCTPTRYGLLTGRYAWRTRLKRGVLNGYGAPLIDDGQQTIAQLVRTAGYQTHVIGKWHLGLGLVTREGKNAGGKKSVTPENLDLTRPLAHHPGTVGFEQSLVIPASLDFPPYVYFKNGVATSSETVPQPAKPFPGFLRRGPRATDFDMRKCLDRLTDAACETIAGMKNARQPQLLYFPLTAPHKPILPAERFLGKSPISQYGDFVMQVDATVGRVLDAIDQAEIADETMVLVTSDNGSYMYRYDDQETRDHTDDVSIQGYRADNHRPNGPWRGTKADIYEAGHRVPFFVRMPNGQRSGERDDQLVGLVDVFATLAELCGASIADNGGPDSHSFAKRLGPNHTSAPDRPPLVCHSVAGMFALRDGPWKLIAGNGSGGRQRPKGTVDARP
ncbi:MAG: arylsulfatase, partial [Planctomycetota bacterium]